MTNLKKEAKKIEKELDFNWAQAVKNRDRWRCVICQDNNIVHAHHLLPRENKDTRCALWNGLTLCCLHHKFSLEISPHRNACTFFFWLRLFRHEIWLHMEDYLKARNELIWTKK